jgi:hypothetical protein
MLPMLQISDASSFDQVADQLLNRTVLVVNQKGYRLYEIEFYLHNQKHPDLYTHRSNEQRMMGKWYFHRYATGTYKSGTYKGLDLTLSPDQDTYCGVLIRSIQDLSTGQVTEGPCRSVNLMLSHFGCETVNDFIGDKRTPLPFDEGELYLRDDATLAHQVIYKGPRIGLSDKFPEYRNKPYRYAIGPSKLKKQRTTLVQV